MISPYLFNLSATKNHKLASIPNNDKSNHNEKNINARRSDIVLYENGCKNPPVNISYL